MWRYSAKPRGCCVIRRVSAARNDVPKIFSAGDSRTEGFSEMCAIRRQRKDADARPKDRRNLASGGLPGAPWRQPGRSRQTANCKRHTPGETPRDDSARSSQTALAACRVALAGAAETGAGRRQPPFDPIRASGFGVGRHGNGRRGDTHRPCYFVKLVKIHHPGRLEQERRDGCCACGLLRVPKCTRGRRGNLDGSAPS